MYPPWEESICQIKVLYRIWNMKKSLQIKKQNLLHLQYLVLDSIHAVAILEYKQSLGG